MKRPSLWCLGQRVFVYSWVLKIPQLIISSTVMLINVDKCNSYNPRYIWIFNTFKKVKGLWDQRFWTLLLWMSDFCFCPTRVARGSPFLAPSFCRSCSCHDDSWPPSLPHIWTTLLGFPPDALLTPPSLWMVSPLHPEIISLVLKGIIP